MLSVSQAPRRVYLPDFLPFGVPSNNSIDDRGFPRLRVGIVRANRVDFDVFRVIDVDKLFVDIGTVGSWVVQGRVKFTRLVSYLD